MVCKICGKETSNENEMCIECELNNLEEQQIEIVEQGQVEVIEQESKKEKEVEKTNRSFAVASLVLGMCALFIPILNMVTAILAIVFGAIGRKHDLGIVGMVAGIIYIANYIIVSIMSIIFMIFYFGLYFFIFFAGIMGTL